MKAAWIPEGPAAKLRPSGFFGVPPLPLPDLLPLPAFARADP